MIERASLKGPPKNWPTSSSKSFRRKKIWWRNFKRISLKKRPKDLYSKSKWTASKKNKFLWSSTLRQAKTCPSIQRISPHWRGNLTSTRQLLQIWRHRSRLLNNRSLSASTTRESMVLKNLCSRMISSLSPFFQNLKFSFRLILRTKDR